MENKLRYKDLLLIYKNWWLKRIKLYMVYISLLIIGYFSWASDGYLSGTSSLNGVVPTDPLAILTATESELMRRTFLWATVFTLIVASTVWWIILDKKYLFQALTKSYPNFSIHPQKKRVSWMMYLAISFPLFIYGVVLSKFWTLPVEADNFLVEILNELVFFISWIFVEMITALPLLGWLLKKSKKFTIIKHL